ncbi:MAG: sensor domain-containing protein, partial [Chloroflexota bacterium]
MIAGPLLVLGLLLALSATTGAWAAGRRRGAAISFVLSPLDPASWRAVAAIFRGAIVLMVAVTIVGSLFSGGVSLLIAGIGFLMIGLGIEVSRAVARSERRRMAIVESRPLLAHYYRSSGSTLRDRALSIFADLNRWRDVLYVFVALPLALLEAVVVLVLWTTSIILISMPIWASTATGPISFGSTTLPAAASLAAGLVGLVLAPVAASVSLGLMRLHRAVVTGLLCESEQRALERRVETLEVSRKAVLDVEASELRRIERDLHDGAQQRLVMLAMDLSMAADRIETDPAGARELVAEAQGQARQALAEIRDLVRGIAPSILLDRGLVAAVAALAGRSPVPTTISSSLGEGTRLPDTIERAAYYVVAEALTNLAKHASATRCEITFRREGDSLVLEVRDDGGGGARLVPGGGLAGLAGRV